jgi:hypothetical protein
VKVHRTHLDCIQSDDQTHDIAVQIIMSARGSDNPREFILEHMEAVSNECEGSYSISCLQAGQRKSQRAA